MKLQQGMWERNGVKCAAAAASPLSVSGNTDDGDDTYGQTQQASARKREEWIFFPFLFFSWPHIKTLTNSHTLVPSAEHSAPC